MSFLSNFQFAELHMPEVRRMLGNLPARLFFNIDTAPLVQDTQQATDLVLSLTSGDIAVRVRKNWYWLNTQKRHYAPDWSIRAVCHGYKTEIEKLKEGFARWYFMSYSKDDLGQLAFWWLIDLDTVRREGILDQPWPIHPNNDGTAGMYIPVTGLYKSHCILADTQAVEPTISTWFQYSETIYPMGQGTKKN